MATTIPITLVGDNLGKRHLYLNNLVKEAYERNEDFDFIKNLPENSPIDRLFKIDYASKVRNIEYIIENLKSDDMLYVCRALKSIWLLETKYNYIINPTYLESSLFPEMITTAITKMEHWIHLHLKDEERCQQFYEHYYNKKNLDFAIKFLTKCPNKIIQNEFQKVIHKINPHYFKIFCQKCSEIVKIFFDLMPNDEKLKSQYLSNEKDYFLAIRHLLKTDTAMILDINEKYFNMDRFYRFSAVQTKFVMNNHIERFWQKPELYAVWLLNIQAIADSLGSEEAKSLVLKLARAKFVMNLNWFDYKFLEPLVKRVKPEERAEFKKKVFVKKDVGDEVEEWPYETPTPPIQDQISGFTTIFDDPQQDPYEYENLYKYGKKRKIMKKKYCAMKCAYEIYNEELEDCSYSANKVKSLLDKLFDEFRFASFGQALYELRKRITAESSPKNREFMILVLVSKSGGRPENIALLLELLARHTNEPPNVRAAIIRSLVKRAYVWRLPETSWKQLLEFGKGLGLDGNAPEADCYEGLHAVVIRSLLLTGECNPPIIQSFLDQFVTLTDYALNASEKKQISKSLPKLLINVAKERPEIINTSCIDKLIDTLNDYKINIESYPGFIDIVAENAKKDILKMKDILHRLFQAKVARKKLFRYNFELEISSDSYNNALKHDIKIIDVDKFTKHYLNRKITKADTFLIKLSLYFSEENGLASYFFDRLKQYDDNKNIKYLGRPLAYLISNRLQSFLTKLDTLTDVESKLLAASIRSNAHLTRPALDIVAFGWKKAGAKLIGNRVLKCPAIELDNNIENLLKWKHTAKLALTLSKRTDYETEVLNKLAVLRPTVAIKTGLKLLKLYGDNANPSIWTTINPLLKKFDISKDDRSYVVKKIANIDEIPLKIRPDYSTVIYESFKETNYFKAMPPLCHIEILLPNVNEQFIENLLEKFLKEDFILEKQSEEETGYVKCTCMYIRILIKYLFLCKSEDVQKCRLDKIGDPFLAKMEDLRKCPEKKGLFPKYLREVIKTFKYSKVLLNIQYVSPLPVMEKVVVWLQKMFSIDEHFQTFALIHLAMIYTKAVRQAIKSVPEVFADEKIKNKDGVKIVGNLFGKYVAKEVNNLASKYFDSIIEMYHESLLVYLDRANYYFISSDWLSSVIKGILEGSKSSEYRIAVYLLTEKQHSLLDEDAQEIRKYLKGLQNEEMQWFAINYAF